MRALNSHATKDCCRCGDVGAKIEIGDGRVHGYCLTKTERADRRRDRDAARKR